VYSRAISTNFRRHFLKLNTTVPYDPYIINTAEKLTLHRTTNDNL